MARSNPGWHSIEVGEFTVTALNDGQFEPGFGVVQGLSQPETEAMLRQSFRPVPPRITVSCFLIERGGERTLVDFGAGPVFGGVLGHAASRLRALDVEPESIGTILLTHGHGDHTGGLVGADGRPVFPRAELVVHPTEVDFWTSDHAQRGFEAPRAALSAYAARLRHAGDGETVLPGITLRHLPGHTPGHSGFALESGDRSLLIWTDLVHLPGLQFARPEVALGFDVDAAEAVRTRARVLDMAAQDRLLVAGIHLDFPPFGHVARHGGQYAFEPLFWEPTASGLFPS